MCKLLSESFLLLSFWRNAAFAVVGNFIVAHTREKKGRKRIAQEIGIATAKKKIPAKKYSQSKTGMSSSKLAGKSTTSGWKIAKKSESRKETFLDASFCSSLQSGEAKEAREKNLLKC